MSTFYYNGFDKAQIEGRDVNGILSTVTLPKCNLKGSPEKYTQDFIQHTLDYKGRIVKEVNGRRILFELNFEEIAIKGMGLETILTVLKWEDKNSQLFLRAHSDVVGRNLEVIGQNEEIISNLINNGELSEGHSGIILRYITIEIIDDAFDWIDVDNLAVPIVDDFILI